MKIFYFIIFIFGGIFGFIFGTFLHGEISIGSILAFLTGLYALFTYLLVKQSKIQADIMSKEVDILERQSEIINKSAAMPILTDLIKEFRGPDFKAHMEYILEWTAPNPEKGLKGIPSPAKEHVRTVSHFFDHVGFCVAGEFIDEDFIIGYMGNSVVNAWKVLKPFIYAEREIRKTGYQEGFEDLVGRVRNKPFSEIRKKFKLKRLENEDV